MQSYGKCTLCARRCGVDRTSGVIGYCRSTDRVHVARAALHYWEEPIISGTRGSGAIFFSGCSLGCVFCQNREISRGTVGAEVTVERLAEIMLEFADLGAHNINLVTPTHFVPSIREALILAKARGMTLPVVYNTSSYDSEKTLDSLNGLVDIYLPDLKYYLDRTARALSFAENYPDVARRAIDIMIKQIPIPRIESGIMKSGVIVRILVLPSHVAEAKLTLKYLNDKYGDSIYISLMNQYTPMEGMEPPLDRRVSRAEYYDLLEYADRLGIKNGFTQEFGAASEIFIPSFDNTGVT